MWLSGVRFNVGFQWFSDAEFVDVSRIFPTLQFLPEILAAISDRQSDINALIEKKLDGPNQVIHV
jgi:hypothetical protein